MRSETFIEINGKSVPVVIRSYKTSRHLKMYFKAGVLYVSKPKYVSARKAMEFVNENIEALRKMYNKIQNCGSSTVKYWNNGETFMLRGKEYLIKTEKIQKSMIRIQVDNDKKQILICYSYDLNEDEKKYNIDKVMKTILKENTKKYLENRLPYWSEFTKIPYKEFKVNDATSKFGSCIPSKKVLHFSSRLIMLPENIIDAVIVHELCHMIHANHSKDFYDLVRRYMPNYDELNKWLKKYGKVIVF